MSDWKEYLRHWRGCQACPLHATALEKAIYRGPRNADVLFIGEAPGPTEDLVGQPFIGPAGKLLDRMIQEVMQSGIDYDIKFGFANILCCFPVADTKKFENHPPAAGDGSEVVTRSLTYSVKKEGNFRAPTKKEAETCHPHLHTLVEMFVKPTVIVALGKVTASMIPKEWKKKPNPKWHYAEVSHPSYWLRTGGDRGLEYAKAKMTLSEILSDNF